MWNSNLRLEPESQVDFQLVDSEILMKDIQKMYTTREVGLRDSAKSISSYGMELRVHVPRQKTTVLIVGHHCLAKQKFLDLYYDEPRQGQGSFICKVDYEKLDKIFITHGNNRRKMLNGETVLDYCPHLAQLKNVPGVKDYLTTEISSKKTKSLVSFILAPENSFTDQKAATEGTTDDANNNSLHPKTPFHVEKAIETLSEAADLIFIFFDPTGHFPPEITLKPFVKLWEAHHEKLHLILAKANEDECEEEDRESTLTKIVRETWKIPAARICGYLPLIYCPDLTTQARDEERLWNIIHTEANKSVHRALIQLERDATKIRELLLEKLHNHNKAKAYSSGSSKSYLWILILLTVLIAYGIGEVGDAVCEEPDPDFHAICGQMISNKSFLSIMGGIVFFVTVRSLLMEPRKVVLSESEEDLLHRRIQFVNDALTKKDQIEEQYFPQKNFNISQSKV